MIEIINLKSLNLFTKKLIVNVTGFLHSLKCEKDVSWTPILKLVSEITDIVVFMKKLLKFLQGEYGQTCVAGTLEIIDRILLFLWVCKGWYLPLFS